MKFNSADFPLDNKIVAAREQDIYYETEKNSLAETWDRLLEYYNDRIREECREDMEEAELYRMLCTARVEAETGRTVYDLIEKGVLQTYKVRARNRVTFSFKPFILQSCISLLDNGIEDLRTAIEYEEKVYRKIEDITLPVTLVNGEVRIYVTGNDYLKLDEECKYIYPANWKAKGLTCRVRYLDISLECSVPPTEGINEVEAIKEYFLEKSMIQRFRKGRMDIEISEMKCEGRKDPLCRCILDELRNGTGIGEVCNKTMVYLSRMLVDRITDGCMDRRFLMYTGNILCDGLSETFFVLTNDRVIHVSRNDYKLEILVNGLPVRFSGPRH